AAIFLQVYVDSRELHSIPTRRSSDLKSGRQRHDFAGGKVRGKIAEHRLFCESRRRCGVAWRYGHQRFETVDYGCTLGRAGLFIADRKSTRLNSSHVKISYAVFCLKKK